MKTSDYTHLPLVLSSFDLPDSHQLLVFSCEDCACPVSNDIAITNVPSVSSPFHPSDVPLIRGLESVEIPLENDYYALFNPLSQGGVVVINDSARQILLQFQQPCTIEEASTRWGDCPDGFEEALKRLNCLGMVHPADQPQQPRFQPSQVLTAWLHVTNACNLRCPYCYINKTNEGMDEATGRAAVEAVIRSAMNGGFREVKLKYAGGEATLSYKLVLKLHDYAQELSARHGLKLHAVILSNGVSFPSMLIESLRARGIRVMISLDGIGDYHDTQRPTVNGKPSFHLVERNIARMIQAGYPPHISVTVTNRNLKGLPEVVRFALERNLTFSLNFFRDNECSASFQDLKYEEQAMINTLREAFGVIEEYLPPWSVLGTILDRGQLIQPRLRPCGVGQDYIVITERGEVAKCHMVIEKTLGDVFQSDLLALIRDDKDGLQNPSVEEKGGCRECTWRYWCSGGCPQATYRATGRSDIKSPNCNIYKAIYPEALRLEGLRLLKYATN